MPRVIEAYVLVAMAAEWESQAAEQLPDTTLGHLVRRTITGCADDLRRVLNGWSTNIDNE